MYRIIYMLHTESNTGYAIEKLEKAFLNSAIDSGLAKADIYFSYPSIQRGKPKWMSEDYDNFTQFNFNKFSEAEGRAFSEFLVSNSIKCAFCFDLQPSNQVNRLLRRAGVNKILSYWGAPMSSPNRLLKLMLKRLEVWLRMSGPDFYIFESEAMRELAIYGRGIPAERTFVVPTGVDVSRFQPPTTEKQKNYAHDFFNIRANKKIFCYSGHMEERKGVHIIIKAMEQLVCDIGCRDIHFLVLGNKDGEEQRFFSMVDKMTFDHITFGGYCNDIEKIFASCYAGILASSGWDSWPMSVIEMAASGLPLIVSRLQGLLEFVVDGENGYNFESENHIALATAMIKMAENAELAKKMGHANHQKVQEMYTDKLQQQRLAEIIHTIFIEDRVPENQLQ